MTELIEELNRTGKSVIFLGDGVPVYRELIEETCHVPYSFAPAHINKREQPLWQRLPKSTIKKGKWRTLLTISPITSEYHRLREKAQPALQKKKMLIIRDMRPEDTAAAAQIEAENFSRPWKASGFLDAVQSVSAVYFSGRNSRRCHRLCRYVDSSG